MSFATEDRVLSIVVPFTRWLPFTATKRLKRRKAWKDPKGNSAYTVNFA